jgi:hypothetical protein
MMSTGAETTQFLQWAGCATGVLGSAMLAWRSRWSGWGFVVYLVSNACWIAFGLVTQAPGLVVMQSIFTVTSGVGVWRWLLMPRRACGHVPRQRTM